MYEVTIEHDGCYRATLNGGPYTYEQAIALVSKYLPPLHYEFSIVSVETKRCISYVFQPVRRRTRLTMNYFQPK